MPIYPRTLMRKNASFFDDAREFVGHFRRRGLRQGLSDVWDTLREHRRGVGAAGVVGVAALNPDAVVNGARNAISYGRKLSRVHDVVQRAEELEQEGE